ncbi:MAG TPA: FxDxF family PEP-CTERM protein, partial [Telluria sp.]|nr:FxDxF family PEP-CTERM protein [Telluria sp.]
STAGNSLVASGKSLQPGPIDVWTISSSNLAAGDYYLQVNGNLVSNQAASFGGAIATTMAAPVPEPETYGMMLGGLGVLGFLARRRKAKQA